MHLKLLTLKTYKIVNIIDFYILEECLRKLLMKIKSKHCEVFIVN